MAETSSISAAVETAAARIVERSGEVAPDIAMVLGSGLGPLAEEAEDAITIPYSDLPGFPRPSIAGHAGELVIGRLQGRRVAMLRGRVHMYEGHGVDPLKVMIRTMKAIGAPRLFLTCAAGSTSRNLGPGRLMVIGDHINNMGLNPLAGPNEDEAGPRFLGLDDAWSPALRDHLKAVAAEDGIDLAEGVYQANLGPTFETPAEIRAFGRLGADAVGMSTVPDCIIARHCGLEVVGVAVITNYGAGLFHEPLSHEHTLKGAELAREDLKALVRGFLASLPDPQLAQA